MPLRAHTPAVRASMYGVLTFLSFMLFALSTARITYTAHLAPSDPLNHGVPFTDSVVVELLLTSLLFLFISPIWVWILWKRVKGWYARVWIEISVLSVLWCFLLIGMEKSTSIWPNLSFCATQIPCAVLQAMVAFAWLAWVLLSVMIGIGVVSAFRRRGWKDWSWEYGTMKVREPVFRKMRVDAQASGSVVSVNSIGAESVGGEGVSASVKAGGSYMA
ncbi:hypothetical protein SISSUDRAFT_1054627 [Sistotremastrum suecicum HHB10207 ss-3]|uniref:MARVEL domain-containing protein n=1 Tax=Sistotremastrum suecicum HHB10207 ss-3 TaxID=1314776 RepID=A0A165YCV7_9AGAM|nr:hypothetical protein SISSUDRAFT_1054627 [Sistotremastrum suecicum HHB10207 ss-3]